MKNKHLLVALALVLTTGFTVLAQSGLSGGIKLTNDGNQVVKDLDPMNAANWISSRRVNQYTGTINLADVVKAQEQVKALSIKGGNSFNLAWNELGPNNIGGRTRAFLIDKDNPDVCFAGSVGGGLWKTTTAGTSWGKTQTASGELFENLSVSCITQATNGDIYFGTGEGPAITLGNIQDSHQGILGQGIWKSVDHGNTFSRLESTWSSPESKEAFVLTYAIAADPTNASKVYAATEKGLRVTTDGGQTWTNPIPELTSICDHVAVGSNGTVMASVGAMAYRSTSGDAGSFTKVSANDGLTLGLIMDKNVSRMMFAFAPGDPNYVYCIAAGVSATDLGSLSNVFQSKDGGLTWAVIGPGGASRFAPLGNEGYYACAIAVDPFNPGHIMVAGKDVYDWSYVTGWERITLDNNNVLPITRGFFVHRDQHTIVFDPTDANTVYIGTSGGVAVTNNKGITWKTLNRNYNVTQFLSVAYSPKGAVLGGSMDNGILYMDYSGIDPMYANLLGGTPFDSYLTFRHGGDCEISTLDPTFKFYTTPSGTVHRRLIIQDQDSYQAYYPIGNGGTWLSPIKLWEKIGDVHSWDSVLFIADRDYAASETIIARSMINKYPLPYQLTTPLLTGDTVKIQDTYQAALLVGKAAETNVDIGRHPLSGMASISSVSTYYSLLERKGTKARAVARDYVVDMEMSTDGDNVYTAMWDNSDALYRLFVSKNYNNCRDRKSMDTDTGWDPITGAKTFKQINVCIGTFTQVPTSIAVDPTNANNVLVTCGNYGNAAYIYRCTNALTAEDSTMNFVSVQGNLPQAPVYSVMFNWRNHSEVIVGTEYGVYSTTDIFAASPEWANENGNGMEILPVYEVRQQHFENSAEMGIENHGVIYAATFGRGLYSSETFATKGGASSSRLAATSTLNVQITPNPVADQAMIRYSQDKEAPVEFQIFDMQGKMVKNMKLGSQPAGSNELYVEANDLTTGTYLLRMVSGGQLSSIKFVVK